MYRRSGPIISNTTQENFWGGGVSSAKAGENTRHRVANPSSGEVGILSFAYVFVWISIKALCWQNTASQVLGRAVMDRATRRIPGQEEAPQVESRNGPYFKMLSRESSDNGNEMLSVQGNISDFLSLDHKKLCLAPDFAWCVLAWLFSVGNRCLPLDSVTPSEVLWIWQILNWTCRLLYETSKCDFYRELTGNLDYIFSELTGNHLYSLVAKTALPICINAQLEVRISTSATKLVCQLSQILVLIRYPDNCTICQVLLWFTFVADRQT